MTTSRPFLTFALGLAIAAGTGCSSDHAPLAPAAEAPVELPAPDASLLGGLLGGVTGTVDGLLGTSTGSLIACDVRETAYAAEWIGPAGGVVRVGPHTLVIPRGALTSYTRIRATAPRGKTVLVDFEPHGLKFRVPTALSLSYRDCGLVGGLLGSVLYDVVYVDDRLNVLEVLPSLNDVLGMRVTGRVDHFSGYALSERKGSTSDASIDGGF